MRDFYSHIVYLRTITESGDFFMLGSKSFINIKSLLSDSQIILFVSDNEQIILNIDY